jgi:hypothetical protein
MPSEDRTSHVFEALQRPIEAFRSALAGTIEQVRGEMPHHPTEAEEGHEEVAAHLGAFAAGRIDPERFSALGQRGPALDDDASSLIHSAVEAMSGLLARKNGLFRAVVQPEGNARYVVAGALAEIGRAFGAARTIDLCRTRRYVAAEHATLLTALPFRSWKSAERRLAPPLVVQVAGEDCQVDGLAEFLDGSTKIMLLVEGEAPPVPLVRLVTPGVFVQQTTDAGSLERFAAWDGPGIAALLPDGAARFVHDPTGGHRLVDRLVVEHLPGENPRRARGGSSAAQQAEQLRQLRTLVDLARRSAAAESPPASPPQGDANDDPAGKLAAWLLQRANLGGPG